MVAIDTPSHGRINEIAIGKTDGRENPPTIVMKLEKELSELPLDRDVILNLSGLDYIASSTVPALKGLEEGLGAQGRLLAFCGLNRTNLSILGSTWPGGFNYTNHPDEASALTELQARRRA